MSDLLKVLDPDERAYFDTWRYKARDEQLLPDEWGGDGCFIWIIRAGRGWGKTKTAAETFIAAIQSGEYTHPSIAGATAEEVRDIMIEGESGLLSCAPKTFYPEYIPSLKKLVWPNGVVSHIFYGTEPDKARGQNSDFIWMDEIAKYQYPEETCDNLLMGLRLGKNPRCMITSTPRPTRFLMDLEKRTDRAGRKSCVVSRGNTEDNFHNLSPVFISTIISKYQGTRLGRQELEGQFLDDNPDALWKRADIDNNRVRQTPQLSLVVVGVDPAVTSKAGSDDTGIIVVGKGIDSHGYVLGDYTIHDTPQKWAAAAITAYHQHKANKIIGETNNGGDLVELNIKTVDPSVRFEAVHASRGKAVRAEPASSLYEQCVAKGTFISTSNGLVKIEDVKTGDSVWTRKGLKKVTWSGFTGFKETIKIKAGGNSLICTPNHPIYTQTEGFIRAEHLVHTKHRLIIGSAKPCQANKNIDVYAEAPYGRRGLCAEVVPPKKDGRQGSLNENSLSLTENGIINNQTGITEQGGIPGTNYYTARYGDITTGRYQRVGIYTTSMKTKGIIAQKTWGLFLPPITADYTILKMGWKHNHRKSEKKSVYTNSIGGRIETRNNIFATNAETNLNPSVLGLGFAHLLVMQSIGLGSVEKSLKMPVYNIEVEGSPEYFANGILVHNCRVHHVGTFPELEDQMCEWIPGEGKSPDRIDALVWALTSLNIVQAWGQVPKSPLPEEHFRESRSKESLFGGGNMPTW